MTDIGPNRAGDDEERPVRWRELLAQTVEVLGDRQHARWICETASSTTADEFLAALDEPATVRMVQHLDAMVLRARQGEPIQYVVGRWGFRRLDLAVDRRVLIPRPETELLAGLAIEKAAACAPERVVVDLGTGSGAIGLAMADELPIVGTTVWITDVDPDALDVARANLAGLGRAAANVRVAQGSWFEALPDDLVVDVVVSNPPYVADGSVELEPQVANWEPTGALLSGPDGLDDLRVVVHGAFDRLAPGGWLLVEHGHDQAPAVAGLMCARGYIDVRTEPDLAGHPRVTLARHPT